ncbi:MAG: hypothetical protein WA862_03760 [Solirubrobacterales bacterium]
MRESRSTPAGPRSRTLAGFKELTDATIEKVQARAAKPPSAAELRAAALKAGAPVAGEPVDEAARELLGLIANGKRVDPMLERLLLDALADDRGSRLAEPAATVSDSARAATEWIDAGPRQRGETLRDLLLLSDALPVRIRSNEIGFPRLRSA